MTNRNPWKKLLNKVKLCGSKHASRSRIKEVTITEQDLINQWNFQSGCCYWLGIPLNINDVYTTHNPLSPSVDRLDNEKDYHKDNIVITCSFANMGRGKINADQFSSFISHLKAFLINSHIRPGWYMEIKKQYERNN